MPVIINAKEKHPFLPKAGDTTTIDLYRAEHQDIRPMEILMVNLMADKITTERQITALLGDTEIQVNITFAATDEYLDGLRNGRQSLNTPNSHILDFYQPFSQVRARKFDGLVVTGMNALCVDLKDEIIWPHLQNVLEWSKTNVTSTLMLCWAAQGGLEYFYGIGRSRRAQKLLGLYEHETLSDKCGLLHGFPDRYLMPMSNWDHTHPDDILACKDLELMASDDMAGAAIICEPQPYDDGRHYYPKRLFVLNHPEYDTDTIDTEYRRDVGKYPDFPIPSRYYPDDDVTRKPLNTWRHTGKIYANWVRALYNATPYDINEVPKPYYRERK